mmetsp:Transcript_28876/g.56475  ORF Transcript_28876/g.56475 Transcript_28876/m.56475 type:complete len:100 (+) Transcript_28876:1313-1612(+)
MAAFAAVVRRTCAFLQAACERCGTPNPALKCIQCGPCSWDAQSTATAVVVASEQKQQRQLLQPLFLLLFMLRDAYACERCRFNGILCLVGYARFLPFPV